MPETVFTGKVLIELNEVESTNRYAADLLSKATLMEGTVVTAAFQTGGRGYSGNSWESEAGKNLLVSIILKPVFLPPKRHFFINEIVSLAVRETVQHFAKREQVKIKWPNDIICNDKKIAGILIENAVQGYSIQHTIAGIGLNVNQTDFAAGLMHATSLRSETGKEHDVKKVLDDLCEKMEYRYLQLRSGRMEEIQKEYMKQLYRVEEDSMYQANDKRFHAKIMGLTAEGKIVLQVNDHHEVYGFKEVEMIF